MFRSSIKRELDWHFQVVVVHALQSRQRNVQKSVIHVQSYCLLLFAVLVAVGVVVA